MVVSDEGLLTALGWGEAVAAEGLSLTKLAALIRVVTGRPVDWHAFVASMWRLHTQGQVDMDRARRGGWRVWRRALLDDEGHP
jgi:hypothetical protein